MKHFVKIACIAFLAISVCSCAPAICPANGREYQNRQLAKFNQKRKRDIGLFPKSMDPSKRKAKKKANKTETTDEY
ncbi:hypothetical protein GC194_02095 [bacterium]|nr:hypothetical protein [bacterium]